MANPALVEVMRGGIVESAHTGAFVVLDPAGRIVEAAGEIDRPVFPRSAVKALQALPLIESGAADRFGLSDPEIALACASHSGEALHAETAASMLAKAGQSLACLECGTHWPMDERAARSLAAKGGTPSALHNNCSGKHSGFVCVAIAMGQDPKGYIAPEHPTMRVITSALGDMTGVALEQAKHGVDGCSIPTFAIPLRNLALGFARFGSGEGLEKSRAKAASRIREAVAKAPFMVAGTGRADTGVMEVFGQRAFVKMGAEGVYCATFPEKGYGIALKIDDGATRASEIAMAALISRHLVLGDAERAFISRSLDKSLVNWNGIEVGRLRPASCLRP